MTRGGVVAAGERRMVAARGPNRYPALRTEIQLVREGLGIFDGMAGVGAHEVVIETRDHRATLATNPSISSKACCGPGRADG